MHFGEIMSHEKICIPNSNTLFDEENNENLEKVELLMYKTNKSNKRIFEQLVLEDIGL
jgi:hypothetical protein